MFEGFTLTTIDTGETTIHVRHGGSGTPLLLLHGIPQTHLMWHKIVPALARDFTVVATDLRGYGDSGMPPTTPDHAPYAMRALARDQVAVMRELGFTRFDVAGHDRGDAAPIASRSITPRRWASWPSSTSSRPGRRSVAPTPPSRSTTGSGPSSPRRIQSPSA